MAIFFITQFVTTREHHKVEKKQAISTQWPSFACSVYFYFSHVTIAGLGRCICAHVCVMEAHVFFSVFFFFVACCVSVKKCATHNHLSPMRIREKVPLLSFPGIALKMRCQLRA